MKSGEQELFEATARTGMPPRPPRREGRESRVVLADVQNALREAMYPSEPHKRPMEAAVIAERAGVSERTVYRYANESVPLDTADRLLMAVDVELHEVRVIER